MSQRLFFSCLHKTVRKQSISEPGEILYDKQGAFTQELDTDGTVPLQIVLLAGERGTN